MSVPLREQLWRRKPIVLQNTERQGEELKRSLSTFQLMMFGVGATVGGGGRAGLPGESGGAAGGRAGLPGGAGGSGGRAGLTGESAGGGGRAGLPGGAALGGVGRGGVGLDQPGIGTARGVAPFDSEGSLRGKVPGAEPTGGWRDLVTRTPSEPGLISRGPTAGTEFAQRLPATRTETAGTPFLGGMGVGAGVRSTEHRTAYWVRSADPFDVPLPPYGDSVLTGRDG